MLAHLFQERCDYFCEADSAAAVRVLWVLSQYYFYCCQIIWLLLLIRSTRTYYDLWGEVHRIFSSLCKITAKGYGLPYNSDSGMSQNYVDYEAWLWNRLCYCCCPPEYNNINLVVKNEYDNRKKGKNLMVAKHKARKGNICWIVVYCQQGLHASRIKSVHLFTAMQMSFSWMNRKLAATCIFRATALTFFMAQKIHLSRVVSAVKDELRPRKWFIGRLAMYKVAPVPFWVFLQ